jgi:hypothetical protein
MEAITVHPKNKEQLNALEIIFKAMKIPFEKSKVNSLYVHKKLSDESPYNPEFVAMVKKADEDFKRGKGKTMKLDDIWK